MMSLVVYLLLLVSPAIADYICGPELGVEIKRVAWEGLGIRKIQAIYDTEAEFQVDILNGGKRVSQVASDLSTYIGKRQAAVRANQAAILKSLDGTASLNNQDVGRCCDLDTSSLTYVPHLKTMVDTRTMCVWGSAELDHINGTTISRNIIQSMKNNAGRLPHLGWQHYTINNGFHFTFMAHKLCQKLDPRDRPFYKESISPTPMDIVIAIDVSDHGNLHLKTKAATTIVTSTDSRNRIAIVKFCRDAWAPLGDKNPCVSSRLALATSPNVKTFIEFLAEPERERCGNEVNYLAGIIKAFRFFEKDTKTGKVLVFLTDSDPGYGFSHEDIRQKTREENLRVNNSVIIVTYGFGSGTSSPNLLQDLASNTSYPNLDGIDIEGSYNNINSTTNLHHQLRSFYSILAAAHPAHHPIITAPYLDTSGLGLVISVCLPIVQESKLRGVTCVDERVEDMFLNVTYYSRGFRAYMFLVDTAGRTILHPLLPRPCSTHQHPVLVHISTLEKGQGMQDVIDSMTKGETGYTCLYVERRFDYGERPVFRKVSSHYYWTKVNNTDFSLCLVFTDEDGDISMRIKRKGKVNFHDSTMIGIPPGTSRCEYKDIDVTTGGSTVAFNGSAYKYIDYQLRAIRAQGLRNYFVGFAEDQGQQFVDEMKAQVELTGRADSVWSSRPSSSYDSLIDWRFLVTKGLIRLYPGTTFKTFDPTLQGWYQNAISNRGKVVFTRIRKNDIWTIVLSSVIFAGNPTGHHSSQDLPVAVVAGEFSSNYFFQMMEKTFPICQQNNTVCFLVDDKGFILVHTFHIDSWRARSHLVSLEPEVAQELQKRGHLTKYKCLDLLNYRTIHSWTLSPEDWIVKDERFELHRVAGTNIFAGIVLRSTDMRSKECDCKNVTQCRPTDLCDCPCHETLTFDYCRDKPYDLDGTPPCAIEDEIFDPIIKTQASAGQPTCIKKSCTELITKEECSGNIRCAWCRSNGAAGCRKDKECRKSPSPQQTLPLGNFMPTCEKETGITNLELVKGIFIGMAIAVVVCAVISFVYRYVGISGTNRAREGDYVKPPIPRESPIQSPIYTTIASLPNTAAPAVPPRTQVLHEGGESSEANRLAQGEATNNDETSVKNTDKALQTELKYTVPGLSHNIPNCLAGTTNGTRCIYATIQGAHGGAESAEANDYVNSKAVQTEWEYNGPSLSLNLPDPDNRTAVVSPVPGPSQGNGAVRNENSNERCRSYGDIPTNANERSCEGDRLDEGEGVIPADLEVVVQSSPHDSGYPGEGSTSDTTIPKLYV